MASLGATVCLSQIKYTYNEKAILHTFIHIQTYLPNSEEAQHLYISMDMDDE